MKIQAQPHGNVTVLVPHGPLVNEEVPDLRRAVQMAGASSTRRTVLDLADVPYLDSTGIETLQELCGVHVPARQRVKLAALSETCLEALELTDILTKLEAFDTVENAIKSCRGV